MEEFKIFSPEIERSVSNINSLENSKSANFDVRYTDKDFSAYFSNLTENLVSKLPNSSNKYGMLSVNVFFYRQHFYKQYQAQIGKKLSKC